MRRLTTLAMVLVLLGVAGCGGSSSSSSSSGETSRTPAPAARQETPREEEATKIGESMRKQRAEVEERSTEALRSACSTEPRQYEQERIYEKEGIPEKEGSHVYHCKRFREESEGR